MFAEPLDIFMRDFGVDGLLAGAPVRVIYDAPGVQAVGVASTEPQVQIRSDQVPDAWHTVELVVPAGTFRVREHMPNGTGMSLLLLERI